MGINKRGNALVDAARKLRAAQKEYMATRNLPVQDETRMNVLGKKVADAAKLVDAALEPF